MGQIRQPARAGQDSPDQPRAQKCTNNVMLSFPGPMRARQAGGAMLGGQVRGSCRAFAAVSTLANLAQPVREIHFFGKGHAGSP